MSNSSIIVDLLESRFFPKFAHQLTTLPKLLSCFTGDNPLGMKLFQSLLLPYALYCRVAQRLPVHSRLDSRLLLSTSTNLKKSPVARAPVILNDEDIEESFVKGSGPGGQKINKRSNRVRLVHKPTGTTVSCQDFRDLTSNRKHARTLLKDKLDALINGENSKLAKKIEKIRKRKAKSRRFAEKYLISISR